MMDSMNVLGRNVEVGMLIYNGRDFIENLREIQLLDQAISSMDNVVLEHVPGHSGNYGNDQANKLAKQGAMKMH